MEEKARRAWKFARRHHTRENFSTEYRNVILSIIEDVQNKNRSNPKVETADPSVFDILRQKVQEIDSKVKNNQVQKGATLKKKHWNV